MGIRPRIAQLSELEQCAHAVNFVLCVAWCLVVIGIGPCEVNGLVGNIQVSGYHNWFQGVQAFYVGEKSLVPLLAKGQPLKTGWGVRRINRNEEERIEFSAQNPAFLI